jgi:hypothetical protein
VVPDGAIKERRGSKGCETLSEEKGERSSSGQGRTTKVSAQGHLPSCQSQKLAPDVRLKKGHGRIGRRHQHRLYSGEETCGGGLQQESQSLLPLRNWGSYRKLLREITGSSEGRKILSWPSDPTEIMA